MNRQIPAPDGLQPDVRNAPSPVPPAQSDVKVETTKRKSINGKKVKKITCEDTVKVLECLRSHQLVTTPRKDVQDWMNERTQDRIEARDLSRLVSLWDTDDWREVSLSTLRRLSAVTGFSVCELLGHPRSVNAIDWFQEFMKKSHRISSYVVFIPEDTRRKWKRVHDNLLKPKNGRDPKESEKLDLARKWAELIPVFAASARLRTECGFSNDDDVTNSSMMNMIERRMDWARRSSRKHGELFESIALEGALKGLLAAVCNREASGRTERIPSLLPKSEGNPEVLSLRASFDNLPEDSRGNGYIIYYIWGPKLSPQEVKVLLETHRADIAARRET